jgi:ABC-type bacteriocin/lantibiotic exporter with double-glycine peptidase domain
LNFSERRSFAWLTLGNAFMSLLDIAAYALLLAVVAYYAGATGKLTAAIESVARQQPLAPAFLLLLLFVFKNLCAIWIYERQSKYAYAVATRLSRHQLRVYLDGPYTDFITVNASRNLHRIHHQPIEFAHFVLSGFQQLFTECMLIMLTVVAILSYQMQLFLVLLALLLPALWLSYHIVRRRLKKVRAEIQTDSTQSIQFLQDALHGYVEAQTFGGKPFFLGRYGKRLAQLARHLSSLQVVQWVPGRLVEVFAVAALVLLIILHRNSSYLIDTISLGAFVAAAYKIIPGLGRIVNTSSLIRTYGYTATDIEPESAAVASSDENELGPVESLELKNVSFFWDERNVLNDVSLMIRSGEMLCLSAASGHGKSTLLNVLLGFLKPESGSVSINGSVVKVDEFSSLRKRISYQKQAGFFFEGSLSENVVLGDAQPDEQRLEAALRASGWMDILRSSVSDVHKDLRDQAKNISGGQRQRLSFARTLYKDADLYIFDEPFSELDEKAESELLQQCRSLADSGKMVLLVSHNSRAQEWCDQTIVLNG